MYNILQDIRNSEGSPTISLDTNYDSTEKWEGLEEIFPLIDVFLPNEVEASKISKTTEIEEILEFFRTRISLTVVTRGHNGSVAITSSGKRFYQQAYMPSLVRDPTGAGDSFNAGFLYGYKVKRDIQDGLKYGAAAATICVSKFGACSSPSTLDDLENLIQKTK